MMLILMMEVKSLELNFLCIYGGKEILTTHYKVLINFSPRNWIFRKILKSIIKLWNHVKAFSEWQKAYWGSVLKKWEKQFKAEWEFQKFSLAFHLWRFATSSLVSNTCYLLLSHSMSVLCEWECRLRVILTVSSVKCNQKWTQF